MTLTKLVNGKRKPMSKADKTAKQAKETAFENVKAFETWQYRMRKTDAVLPRYAEDIIDVLTADQFQALPQFIKDAHTQKKTLRAQKPEGV